MFQENDPCTFVLLLSPSVYSIPFSSKYCMSQTAGKNVKFNYNKKGENPHGKAEMNAKRSDSIKLNCKS